MAYQMQRLLGLVLVRTILVLVLFSVSAVVPMLLPLRWVAGTLIFVLPGYTWVAAMSSGHELDPLRRVVLTIGTSLSFVVVAGLILNLTPWGLTASTWALTLSVGALLGAVVATIRQLREPERAASSHVVDATPRLFVPRAQRLLYAGAILMAATAGAIAYTSAASFIDAQQVITFWMLPAKIPADLPSQVQLGMSEQGPEASTTFYARVSANGRVLDQTQPFTIASGHTWNLAVSVPSLPPNTLVEADLYRTDQPGRIYRSVWVWTSK